MRGIRFAPLLASLVAVAIVVVACGDAPSTTVIATCTAGQSLACVGTGGCKGIQVCQADGTFATCACPDASVPVDAGPDVAVVDSGKETSVDAAPDVIEASVPEAGPTGWGVPFLGPTAAASAVAVDANKNVIVGTNGAVSLTKLDANGLVAWQLSFATVYSVATDASGAVFVVGHSGGPTDFGGGTVSAIGYFVAKYDTNGVYQWIKGPFSTVSWRDVLVRPNGNVVAVGALEGAQDLGGGQLVPTDADALALELTSAGSYVRAGKWGGAGRQELVAVTLDGSGNYVATGFVEQSVDFGGGAMTGPISAGSHNAFVVKLDANMAFLKQRATGSTGQDILSGVAIDSAGRVLVSGGMKTSMNFGGATKTTVSQADVVIAALDTNLTEVWSRQYGSTGSQIISGIAADPAGGFAICGWATDFSLGLGGFPSNQQFPYMARFDANGTPVSNYAPGGNIGTLLIDLAYLSNGDFVMAGVCVPVQVKFPWGSMYCPSFNGGPFVTRVRP